MTTFLFWNLNRKRLEKHIANLANEHGIDVIILAECEIPRKELLETLNRDGTAPYFLCRSFCEKIVILTRFDDSFLAPVEEDSRYTIRRLTIFKSLNILLAAAHLPSRTDMSIGSINGECRQFATVIKRIENSEGHRRTIVVGDFNLNPFDEGIIGAEGFHALPTFELSKRPDKIIQNRPYSRFYNPMWAFFGDLTTEPSGTFYHDRSELIVYNWNIFDQVLIRPDLLDYFRKKETRILGKDTSSTFLNQRGLPDKTRVSDHLPIFFRFQFE